LGALLVDDGVVKGRSRETRVRSMPRRPWPRTAPPRGRRIVVGIDGSAASQEALRWAIMLADSLGLALLAVHALGVCDRWHDPDASARSWRRSLTDLVERTWCSSLAQATSPHRVEVRDGDPVSELLKAGATEAALLLVVGKRDPGDCGIRAVGSTADQVLQWAQVPVLVVPARGTRARSSGSRTLRRLVVGVDGSPGSLAALHFAAEVAERLGGAVEVVHVFPGGGGRQALDGKMTAVGAELLAIRHRGVSATTVVRVGDPPAAVLEVAEDTDADLVVVGTRDRGSQGELVRSSVARTVAARASRPTLVVPATEPGTTRAAPSRHRPEDADGSQGGG
jgi:nucleotide-binding universal stress UspA family protein